MLFILYKLYILSHNPKPAHHRKHSAFLHFQNIQDSGIGILCPHNVGFLFHVGTSKLDWLINCTISLEKVYLGMF